LPNITPFLWFDNNAEEAMEFYTGIFPDSKIGNVHRYHGGLDPHGTVITADFTLAGQQFMVLNGGPQFTFTEAISFFVSVDSQDELDEYWDALLADGGERSQCGWLKDKYGLSWQIVPSVLGDLIGGPDPEGAARAMQAMMGMQKLIVSDLESAYAGE
jgi:predicted 3-demethylubiquinone-9 3-methyltransferase (glyoxalase superfamily)